MSIAEPWFKRPFDIALALLGLALSSPLWAIICLAIFLEDRASPFFTQERCGYQGRPFNVLKFRTMKLPPRGKAHLDIDLVDDVRVTKVGKLLRATALDELPSLVNILKGDMSFVGPRPLPFHIDDQEKLRYENISQVPGYRMRSRVRPGLTGIAQVYAAKDASRRNKFRYDNVYVRRMGLLLDIKLLVLSVWVSLTGKWEPGRRKKAKTYSTPPRNSV